MTDVIVRRWDDFGAPNLSGSNLLSTVLDAVLVNGYGNSPGLGWTKPFGTVNGVHVYRMPTGTPGYFLRVDDNSWKVDATWRYAKVTSYESMSDINTGTGKAPLADTPDKFEEFGTWYYGKVGTARGAWILLAGPGWFHLICEMHNTEPALPLDKSGGWSAGGNAFHYYGPIHDTSQSDAYAIALSRGAGTLASWNIYYYIQNGHLMGDGRIFLHRASDQAAGCISALSRSLEMNQPVSVRYPNNRGVIMLDTVKIVDSYRGASALPKEYRGILPLVHVALHDGGSMYSAGVRSLDTIVKDGVTYLCLFAVGVSTNTPAICCFFALSY